MVASVSSAKIFFFKSQWMVGGPCPVDVKNLAKSVVSLAAAVGSHAKPHEAMRL